MSEEKKPKVRVSRAARKDLSEKTAWNAASPPKGRLPQEREERVAKASRLRSHRTALRRRENNVGLGRKDRATFTPGSGGEGFGAFFRDRLLKTTVVTCVVIAIVSAIAIPTAFAKPTTNIILNDGGRVMEAPTSAATVGEFLEDNKVLVGADDLLEASKDTPITEGMEIIIRRSMPVTIHTAEASHTINMVAGTVRDALDRAGVVPAEHDEVYPSPDTYVRSGMVIDHITVQTETIVEEYSIPYKSIEREDNTLEKGETEIAQWGEEGTLQIIREQIWKNGVMTAEYTISEEVTKEAVSEITNVGTYVEPEPEPEEKTVKTSDIHSGSKNTSSGGGSSSGGSSSGGSSGGGSWSGGATTLDDGTPVKYTVDLRVTAYCSACNSGNKTSTGTYPSVGTVAARTSRFAYGTKLFIPGYGYGRVEDTGGFADTTIDVYLGDRETCTCGSSWSTGTYTVYVIE
ncbi:G5 domain-containing protein [Christensenellaceae bacterium OttesenSCG-928-K19]|nr:G5 domain-containing protein [Christensenellaceae bacterium OttesenSCG-928-K19]